MKTPAQALDYFDSLSPVTLAEMLGSWRGAGFETGHPLDGLLEVARWHGKRFDSADDGHPLVHRTGSGRLIQLDPARIPVGLFTRLPARQIVVPLLFPLLNPFLRTHKPKARLRMMDYRGKTSATMIYDAKPINDVFRRIDDQTVLGLMDRRGDPHPYFFKLTRDT